MVHANVVSHDHQDSKVFPNKRIIRSPSKLFSPKYQAQSSLGEENFVNKITIVRNEDEPKETKILEYCAIDSKEGDPSTLKVPCMIGHKFIANTYIDLDLPMNIMSLSYYNTIRSQWYEHRGLNFVRIGMDMHVFVGNMSYVMDFTILENVRANIDPSLSQVTFGLPFMETTKLILDREKGLITFTDGIMEVTFKTSYKDSEMGDLTSKGHDLLSSRVILSDDDVRRRCESALDLESGFYKDIEKLGLSYRREILKK
ncbi:hypothetical protein Tco_0425747 [Tanacetum coccineum]